MTIQVHYKTKKDLKNNVGSELDYTETNIFKDEYTPNGVVIGCDINRKFFAKITIENNIIKKVS
tara:strand:+ start:104 stop:295 length:192 start_codon:yes stop_codon:yes gene_type:complete